MKNIDEMTIEDILELIEQDYEFADEGTTAQWEEQSLESSPKPLKIKGIYKEYTVFLNICSYEMNDRLGITLDYLDEDDGSIMPYANLTVNLPQYKIEFNQAFINGDCGDNEIRFIENYELGTVAPTKYQSGYGKYSLVTFDMERLAEFDPDGVKEYMQMHGNSRAKMTEKKNEYEVE